MKKVLIVILVMIGFRAYAQPGNFAQYAPWPSKWKFVVPAWLDSGLYVKKIVEMPSATRLCALDATTGKVGYMQVSSLPTSTPDLDEVLTEGNSSLQNIEVGNVFTSGAKSSGGYYFTSSTPGQYHQLNVTAPGILTWEMPYSSGQLALSSHLSGYLPLTGGTLTGNLLFTDNTYDIGASGATRPRTGYFGTSVISPVITVNSSTDDAVSVIGSSATGRNGFLASATNSGGQATNYMTGNRGIPASYGGQIYGGSTNAIGNLFGVSRADKYFIFADGANNLGMVVGTTVAQPLLLGTNNLERVRILGSGAIGIGTSSPTAVLHLAAGTATASTAPLKFTSGTNLTTAETGAVEYNGTNLFFTRTGTTRETVITANAVNSVSPTSPNRTITVVIDGVTYYIAAKTTND